ncbi:Vacuolar import and degradation protein 27 [Coemansia sp. RSA 2618]|nr:Vacuolar import and degradation protein 27 [Coemansia sp. RSA 2618]
MNALRSLGKLVWGASEGPEMFKLASGVLYEERAGAKLSRKCVYKDAELCIRKTGTPHQYQLVAVRALDEGEDLSDSLDDERSFLIGMELKFAHTTFEGAHGFKWKDAVADEDSAVFEFIADEGSSKAMRDAFAMAVARCAWERKYRREYTEADAHEVREIMEQTEDEELDRLLSSVRLDDDELEAAAGVVSPPPQAARVADPEAAAAAAAPVALPQWELPPEPLEMADGEVIVSSLGELYLFDAQTGEFVQVSKEVALTVVETGTYEYCMNVAANDRSFTSQVIEPEMNAVFNHDHGSLIWNYFAQGRAYSFSMVTVDAKHYEALHQGMTRAAYETLNRESWSKATVSSQDYMLDAYEEDVEMLPEPETWGSDEEEEEEEEAVQDEKSEDEESEDEESEEDESEDEDNDEIDQIFRRAQVPQGVKTGREAESESESESETESESESEDESERGAESGAEPGADEGAGAKNSKLAVGYKHGRSFVVRGSRIGVFRHTEGDDIVFDTTINHVDDTRGREFTPSTVMLHEQDSALVLQNAQRPNELYKMDLEYGKVVEEWRVHEDVPTVAVTSNTKYGQMTGDRTLVGLSHNMLYRIDPRLRDNMIVQDQQQAYTTKSHFTTAASTESGAVAVGSAKGEIRLFDRLGVRAKTVLPALGEPILGIDVTSDGRYVVATCKTYLLLIDTKLPDDPSGRTGFVKPFPQAQKPAPKRLQLKPEHVVYMGAPISFTPAKFNQAPDGQDAEKTIVTSTGPFVVTWNLRRVLGTGRGDAYHIKQYQDVVVADNFRFGQDRSIVVTLPNDVQSVKRSQLAKPTRESLMIRPSGSLL